MGVYHSIKKFSSSFPGSDFDRITKIRFYPKKLGLTRWWYLKLTHIFITIITIIYSFMHFCFLGFFLKKDFLFQKLRNSKESLPGFPFFPN